ncbi:uncharacterized protein LOC114182350 isoform X3 [Vigna unguiculata]|uniref:uncharacterized protein LOC114182350 isoform X3 n=1 Tax=Vigna unguiculata TaxID=3917 RepID=UPI001015EA97|nr:uncharacterized protein LOC114182350 isoform X3 [Vigna unguiculata]
MKHHKKEGFLCILEDIVKDPCIIVGCIQLRDDDIQTKFNEPARSLDGPIGDRVMTSLDPLTWEQAHRYVLFNSEAIKPFLKQHEEFVFSHNRQGSTRKWNKAEDQCLTFHE